MVSIASSATGELLFEVLNDLTRVWFPIFLGAIGVALASFLFERNIGIKD